jgi:hypothetical protein
VKEARSKTPPAGLQTGQRAVMSQNMHPEYTPLRSKQHESVLKLRADEIVRTSVLGSQQMPIDLLVNTMDSRQSNHSAKREPPFVRSLHPYSHNAYSPAKHISQTFSPLKVTSSKTVYDSSLQTVRVVINPGLTSKPSFVHSVAYKPQNTYY